VDLRPPRLSSHRRVEAVAWQDAPDRLLRFTARTRDRILPGGTSGSTRRRSGNRTHWPRWRHHRRRRCWRSDPSLPGRVRRALLAVGASLEDVVRTRIMLTDITRWRQAAAVLGEYFSDIRPAATFVEVSGFIEPRWLVETEVDAIIEGDEGTTSPSRSRTASPISSRACRLCDRAGQRAGRTRSHQSAAGQRGAIVCFIAVVGERRRGAAARPRCCSSGRRRGRGPGGRDRAGRGGRTRRGKR
jgi:hypothetical protein